MRPRTALLTALLTIFGLIFWLGNGDPEQSAAATDFDGGEAVISVDEGSEGSALPCAVPLAWRVVRVDADFRMGIPEASEALRQAISEWEQAAGRTLFAVDSAAGSPIRLVYGERQARSEERRRLQGEMREISDELERRRTQLNRRTEWATSSIRLYEQRSRDLQERVASHNETVRRWNERGGAPQDVMRQVRAAEGMLDVESEDLAAEARRLEEERAEIDAELTRYDEDVAEYNRRVTEIDTRLPPTRVESGVYREAIRTERGRAPSASREIRVYRFSDREDLVRVLAHELGHSLGLGHVDVTGALMSEEYGPNDVQGSRPIKLEDLNALIARCPRLFEG
jgi:hypothetical protein